MRRREDIGGSVGSPSGLETPNAAELPLDEQMRRAWVVIRHSEADVVKLAGRLRRIREVVEAQHGRWLDAHTAGDALKFIEDILNEERR